MTEQPITGPEPGPEQHAPPSPSEIDRLKAQLVEAEQRARALEISAARAKAVSEHGLAEDLLEFVTAEDKSGALAQAERLAAIIRSGRALVGSGGLPAGGGRNPANAAEQNAKQDEQDRFEAMRRHVPALLHRVLRHG